MESDHLRQTPIENQFSLRKVGWFCLLNPLWWKNKTYKHFIHNLQTQQLAKNNLLCGDNIYIFENLKYVQIHCPMLHLFFTACHNYLIVLSTVRFMSDDLIITGQATDYWDHYNCQTHLSH